MIKLVLSASLMLNILLGLGYLSEYKQIKSEESSMATMGSDLVETQTVSTTMAAPKAELKAATAPTAVATTEETPKKGVPVITSLPDFSEEEVRVANEKMQQEREDFFKTELQLTDAQIEHWEKIKAENFKRLMKIFGNKSHKENDFVGRHRAIDAEEKLYRDGAELFGQKKWQAYLDFRDRFNKNSVKNMGSENHGPALFMEL